jgi:LysM repeat protein
MSDKNKESAQNVIESYRKKQQNAQRAPLLIAAVAILLVAGAGLLIFWLMGSGGPSLPSIKLFSTDTPTPTVTFTPTNTPTVTATPTKTVTPTATVTITASPTASGPFIYQVVQDDNLFAIAAKYKVDLLLLLTINNLDPANPVIRVGDKLTIPGPDTKLPTATNIPSNLRPGTKIQYRVLSGDSLLAIAIKFNTTVDDIKKENKITNENQIFPGQILVIPVNLVTQVPTATVTRTPTPLPGGGTAAPPATTAAPPAATATSTKAP